MDDTPQPSSRRRPRRRFRVVLSTFLLLAVFTVLVLAKIAASGVPRFVLDGIERGYSTEAHSLEIGNTRIMPTGTAYIDAIRLFRPGEAAPAMELQHMQVDFRWKWGRYPFKIKTVLVDQAAIRSLDLSDTPDEPNEPASKPEILSDKPISIVCKRFDFLGVPVMRIRTALSHDDAGYHFSNIGAHFAEDDSEGIGGEIHLEPMPPSDGDNPSSTRIAGNLKGNLVPARVNPALRRLGLESLPDIFADFAAPSRPPRARAVFDVSPTNRNVTVDINAENLLYNGVGTLSASARIVAYGDAADWNGVRIQNLNVVRPEGTAHADLNFDFLRHGVEVDAVSTLDFQHLAQIIDILSFIPWDTYETAGGNRAEAHGFYAFSLAEEPSDLRGTLSAGSFSFRRRVPAKNVSAAFAIVDQEYRFSDIQGRLYDGDCRASATFRYDEADDLIVTFTADLDAASTSLFSQDIFHMEAPDDPGHMDLHVAAELNASTNSLRSITGTLRGKVRDSRLYQTPLFAGFTDFMAHHVPGVDFLVNQDDMDVVADISDNGLHFSTLRIEGALFSARGDGDYWFTDYLDIGVKVSLLKHRTWVGKVLKVALYPVSKLFELEVKGPLAKAEWTPTTLSFSSRTHATDEQKYGPAPEPAEPEQNTATGTSEAKREKLP